MSSKKSSSSSSKPKSSVKSEVKQIVKNDGHKVKAVIAPVPVAVETAADAAKVTITPPEHNAGHAREVAKVANGENKEIAAELNSSDTQKDLTQQIAREVIQEQPQNAEGLTHKEVEKIIAPAVKEVTGDNLEHRSTVPAMVTKIKSEVKTGFEGLKNSNQAKGSQKLADAKAEVTTAAKSPFPVSPEAQLEITAHTPDPHSPGALAEVEKERNRLAEIASGKVGEHRELLAGRTYHFRTVPDPKAAPGASVDEFVGTLNQTGDGKKLSVTLLKGNQPAGTREVSAKDFDIYEVEQVRAYELSHIL